MSGKVPYPGVPVTCDGNYLVSYLTEARITDAGIFYPITPSTQMGELYQQSFAEGKLNIYGRPRLAIEAEGEHAAQGGAIAYSVAGRRVVNFTSGQGIVYGVEQYYHAPGKFSTMVMEVGARALTKHAFERPLWARRRLCRPRHRLDHPVWQRGSTSRRSVRHSEKGYRVIPYTRRQCPGRIPDNSRRACILPPRSGSAS